MGTVTSRTEVLQDIEKTFGLVPQWVQQTPDAALPGFWALMRDYYLAETKIPNKYKELIGIAVSGATRCRYCQLFHSEGARLAGATDEEIAEAAMMGGVTMLGSTFINALGVDYDEFAKETQKIVAFVKEQQLAGPPPAAKAKEPPRARV
jgi:AhpD family alkylhydroperoxidase